MENFKHVVLEDTARLDVYLAKHFPAYSRSQWQAKIRRGELRINDTIAKPAQIVQQGAVLSYGIASQLQRIAKSSVGNYDLPILYEDQDVIVVNKPAGLLVYQPAARSGISIRSLLSKKINLPGERAGIVHRLDRDTSGVLIVARSAAAEVFLKQQFAQRLVEKSYEVLVWGHVDKPRARVELPIAHSKGNYQKMTVSHQGKMGIMEYRRKKRFSETDLLEIKLLTGRTHQIRVQLSYLGHAVVGDRVYSHRSVPIRQFVHARALVLTLPNGEKKHFKAPLADDLSDYLSTLS